MNDRKKIVASNSAQGRIVTIVPCSRPGIPAVLGLKPEIRGEVFVCINNLPEIQAQKLNESLKCHPKTSTMIIAGSGAMNARRAMIEMLTGSCDYVICLDDDVAPAPSYYTAVKHLLKQFPNSVIFGVLKQGQGPGFADKFQHRLQWLGKISVSPWLPAYYIAGNSVWPIQIARDIFHRVGSGYKAGGEEIEGLYLLKKQQSPMIYCPELICLHENKPLHRLFKTFHHYGEGQAMALSRIKRHEKSGFAEAFRCLLGQYKKHFNPAETILPACEINNDSPESTKTADNVRYWLLKLALELNYARGFITKLLIERVY